MKELKFVDVGEGITEGHVQKWLVKDGDTVKEDQSIVQIETDKAVVNVPAPGGGIVKINVPDNTDIKVGDTLAYILDPGESAPAGNTGAQAPAEAQNAQEQEAPSDQNAQGQEQSSAQNAQSTQSAPKADHEILATPSVRKLARGLGISLASVTGTGPNGRVLENDLRSHVKEQTKPAIHVEKFSEVLEEKHAHEIDRVPLSQTRKAIAKNMELAWTIPSAVHMDIIDASSLYRIVHKEKERIKTELGIKLTFYPFIIKATIEALKENPRFNSSYDHEKREVLLKKYFNIGLAAESADGLKVIVIKDADKKGILELAKEIEELGNKIKDNTITLDEMRDSSFTITNIGSLGGGFLSVPIINYPDAAILAVHLIRDWPVVEDGMVKIGKIMPFSVVFDHRVVDGAEAVAFGNAFKKYLEDTDFLDMV